MGKLEVLNLESYAMGSCRRRECEDIPVVRGSDGFSEDINLSEIILDTFMVASLPTQGKVTRLR